MSVKYRILLLVLLNLGGGAAALDLTPPSITTFTYPGKAAGNKVGGIMTFSVTATDNVGVTRVVFTKDGATLGTDPSAPFSWDLNFNGDAPGTTHTVVARAYDAAGNSASATLTVAKPDWNLAGAGATLTANGCFFSVWAPNASRVQLIGNFTPTYGNGALSVHDLQKDARSYWFGFAAGCVAGSRYKYVIDNPGGTNNAAGRFYRLDPRARDTDHSYNGDNGNETKLDYNAGIVVDPTSTWTPFTSPAFNNYVIYQLHVGSFAGMNDGTDMTNHGNGGTVAWFRDIEAKLQYVKDLGFNAIEFLPIQEFGGDRSWGYNPALYFAPESAYGSPAALRHLVNAAHAKGLAVIADVVYNHAGPADNSLYQFDGNYADGGGIYFDGGWNTDWGKGPAWWKQEVQDFFFDNAKMYLADYAMDGLRFDATTQIDGTKLKEVLWRVRQAYPGKYMVAEHLPDNPWITTTGNFHASWCARAHHEFQRAMAGQAPVDKVASFLGWDGYANSWNLVKYPLGSHDDIGDASNGDAEHGLTNWDARHRYFTDLFGGRDNWDARAKARVGWALAATMPGTPMLFMGSESHLNPPWGYWHDGTDANGDHRINWSQMGDATAMPMRAMVAAVNGVRWQNPALRSDTLQITQKDYTNNVVAFKRWDAGNVVLTIVNLGNTTFAAHDYGVVTGQAGQWTQIFCSQDAAYGGWDGACNAFYEPWTQGDGKVYVNLPKESVVVLKLK